MKRMMKKPLMTILIWTPLPKIKENKEGVTTTTTS
jgi:hypothetical protein